jgi:hypothetical protein
VAGGRSLERQLHKQFSKDCLGGEWFRLTSELKRTIKRLLKEKVLESIAPRPPRSNNEIAPELPIKDWIRLPQGRLEGLSRRTLLKLHAAGYIKIAVIQKKGGKRGIRLIHLPSLLKTSGSTRRKVRQRALAKEYPAMSSKQHRRHCRRCS